MLIAGSIGPLGIGPGSERTARATRYSIFTASRLWRWKNAGWTSSFWRRSPTLDVLLTAIDAIRSFSSSPIVAQLTFSEEGNTLGGIGPTEAAARIAQKNVQVIGANCTLGPQSLLPILEGFLSYGGASGFGHA